MVSFAIFTKQSPGFKNQLVVEVMQNEQATLVIQSFGRETEYKRAILTVLSFYAHNSLPIEQTRVLFFTDSPGYFSDYFKTLPVQYILLTPGKIQQMRGEIDFLHRMKIAVIEEAFALTDGPLLYADSDSFFTADPIPLVNQLTPGKAYMHLWEYSFEEMRHQNSPAGKTFRDFLALIESRTFQLPGSREIKIAASQVSWNAGVMFFHPSHRRFIADVYALTGQFYPATLNHASEQYAFSVVLQNNIELQACDEVIYHYWYRIKKKIADDFLEKKMTGTWGTVSITEKLKDVAGWTKMLPAYFEHHLWTYQDHAIQAFNNDDFQKGYTWTLKSFAKSPFESKRFFRDVLYHTGRRFKLK